MVKQRTNYFIYFAAFSMNFVMFSTGICYSWTSPILPRLAINDSSINPVGRPITTSEEGLLLSLINLGLLVGPAIPAMTTSRLGKKTTLLISAAPLVGAHLLCLVEKAIVYFFIARFLMGLATGATWSIVPGYIGEVCEANNRGFLSSLIAVMSSAGLLFGYCVGPFLTVRMFSVVNLAPIILFYVALVFFIPQSPYDLISRNDIVGAENALKILRRSTDVGEELKQMIKGIEADKKCTTKFVDLFKSFGIFRAIKICSGLMAICALSGYGIFIGYTQTIFELGGNFFPSEYSSIIVGSVAFITTIISSQLFDHLGRKILVTSSCALTFISLLAIGTYFYLRQNGVDVSNFDWVPIACLLIFMIGFCSGLASVPYIVLGELFPSHIKPMAASLCTSANFSSTFIFSLCFPYVNEMFGIHVSFWICSFFMGLGFIFCIFVLPETKGKSLQDIQEMLEKKTINKAI